MFSLDPYHGELKGKDGWVAPNGDFYECPYEYHWRFADDLCKKFRYRLEARFFLNLDAEYTLEIKGWVKISLGRVHYHSEKALSQKQMDFLFDYFMANENMQEFDRLFSRRHSAQPEKLSRAPFRASGC